MTEGAQLNAEERAQLLRDHELVNYEVAVQQAMVSFLSEHAEVRPELVREVREQLREEGMTSLGLDLPIIE